MTPDSFSRRTRFSVAAGESPTSRASSTFVRSASACSSPSSSMSTSSSSTAILPNIISSNRLNSVLYAGVGDAGCMTNNRRFVFAALIAAGVLWGTTVPLSKLALLWLGPAWLAFARFGVAAAVLLLVAGRDKVRAVCRPAVLASGAVGYGGSVLLQNLGIVRTSVTHAALIVGATPVLIAIITAACRRAPPPPAASAGLAASRVGPRR